LELIDFDERQTHRLLSTAYIDEPAIAPLYDNDREKDILDAIEGETSTRLLGQTDQLDEFSPAELLTPAFGYGWTYVNAAFTYTRAGGNRFNREGRGVWYAAMDVVTCLREVGFHLTRELRNANETENVTDYVQLLAHLAGKMVDLRAQPAAPCLNPDPAIGYPEGQKLAAEIRAAGHHGVVYPSVRHPGGICIAALQPAVIRQVAKGRIFRLTWIGGKGPKVEEIN